MEQSVILLESRIGATLNINRGEHVPLANKEKHLSIPPRACQPKQLKEPKE
jgi:hypothetical protein